jgi:uncharacterized protein (TIGR02145 family)
MNINFTITTNPVIQIKINTAQCGGEIINADGANIQERGVCWSTSPDPTTAGSRTSDETGEGSFISLIDNLAPNTKYYARAYFRINAIPYYGEEVSFTTKRSNAISDIDGNYYNIVTIGDQVWMANNLNTTRYASGDYLMNGTGAGEIPYGVYAPMWFAYNDVISYVETYGRLYTGYAVIGNQNICPAGWHVPNNDEWMELIDHLGGLSVAGGALKEAGFDHWISPNVGATNSSGFTALPHGIRRQTLGTFAMLGRTGSFWTSTEYGSDAAYAKILNTANESVEETTNMKIIGHGVRCVKDAGAVISLPEVMTYNASNITYESAQGGGSITDEGGTPVTARGVCWSTSTNPTIADSHTVDGLGIGTFSSSISGLTANTTYYVRAFATNNDGTAYGNEVSFMTCPLTISVEDFSNETDAGSNDGYINTSVAGDAHVVSYSWLGPNGYVSSDEDISNLTDDGMYTVTVTDQIGCVATFLVNTIPIIVTNVDDSGDGSLRNALDIANAQSGLEKILFQIPGTGPHTIQLGDYSLPGIHDPVVIDGYSQAGASMNTNGPGLVP